VEIDVMGTQVRRINMMETDDLNSAITDLSDNMLAGDFELKSTFVVEEHLVLIYQNSRRD